MTFEMFDRLFQLARYNRDWLKYLLARYRNPGSAETAEYRLRNGQVVSVLPEVRFTLNEIYLDRVYDVPGVKLSDCRTILDLGANMGVFASYAAAESPNARIFCFEPSSRNFAFLQNNLARNAPGARGFHYAIAARNGTATLSLNGSSAEYALGASTGDVEEVECVDFDRISALTDAAHFDFVKMDIEGVERELLDAWSDTDLSRIGALSMEWHHSEDERLAALEKLRQAGFSAESVDIGNVRYIKAQRS